MKIILVMVSSLDGKTTKGNNRNIHSWTSIEDQKHFQNVIKKAKLIIMGSKTYDAAKNNMEHKKGRLRIVLTHNPEKYFNEKIKGILEFTNENPKNLIRYLESEGYKTGFLVGGGVTNTQILKQGLVKELWLTLEPIILGKGKSIIDEEEMQINLKLLSIDRLNTQGTLLLKCSVKS